MAWNPYPHQAAQEAGKRAQRENEDAWQRQQERMRVNEDSQAMRPWRSDDEHAALEASFVPGAALAKCPRGHQLTVFTTPAEGYTCSFCHSCLPMLTKLHGCRACNFDLCHSCFTRHAGNTEQQERQRQNPHQRPDQVPVVPPHVWHGPTGERRPEWTPGAAQMQIGHTLAMMKESFGPSLATAQPPPMSPEERGLVAQQLLHLTRVVRDVETQVLHARWGGHAPAHWRHHHR